MQNTMVIKGMWKGKPVIRYCNPQTGLNVIRGADGQFVSGWKLEPWDIERLLRTG